MPLRSTPTLALVAALFAALLASPSFAQDGDVAAAREEFWQGNEAYVAQDYPSAVLHFQNAYRLAPNARVQEYLGRTYVAMGNYPDALTAFERAIADDPELADEVGATIDQLLGQLAERARGGAVQVVRAALARARGEQPRPMEQRRMELGTIMSHVPVQITSTPRGAEVFIDGEEFGAFGVTPLQTPLFTGPHLIEVRAPFHEPARRIINVTVPERDEEIPSIAFELERQVVPVSVTVTPRMARATFVSDGGERVDLGTGGFDGELPAGPGAFILQSAGRDRRVETVVEAPDDGGTFEIALAMEETRPGIGLAIQVGTLIVVSGVDEGDVTVDGRSIGTGAGEFEADLTPGPHTLRITLDGHEPFEQTITITANTDSTVYVNALERSRRRR